MFAQTLDIWVTPRVYEVERRDNAGVGALDEHLVRALMDVPEGVPVGFRSLGGAVLLAMEELIANHAVEVVGDAVCRRAIPPVDIVGFAKATLR